LVQAADSNLSHLCHPGSRNLGHVAGDDLLPPELSSSFGSLNFKNIAA
jgi:hypothetical protein